MRLKRFALLVEASRAEQLTKRVSPDFIQAVKKLDASDVRKLLRQFVPLDFVALLQKENPKAFDDYKKGEEKSLNFLIGQVMRKSKGKANADEVKKMIENMI